ncbi:MAG: GMC family oxidoreductase [Acidobacteria bacterium]|nr:GMC family oxidoreductase [Acidobacteriota bacterium]MBI3428353.1 GMC family oxidoreductase [Acidobacteriota bacterium]
MAAKELTERGLRVLVLEAGPKLDPSQFSMNKWAYESMYRGFGPTGWKQNEQWMQDTAGEFSRNFYIKDTEHPYTTDPGKPFMWVRARVVGGKTLHWGRLSWRFSDLDFKAKTHDGWDEDWPISYDEIAPYYDKAEEWIGVSGNQDKLWYLPDGKFLPPMALTCGDQLIKKGAAKQGIALVQPRVAMLTAVKPQHAKYGRAQCHYCGSCGNGCSVGAMFNSLASTLPAAQATGRMTLRTNSIVRHIIVDNNTGKAKGVAVVDRQTRQEQEFFGKVVIVAGSTLESTRLLLNSKSRQHPKGLGNSSGVLGHYLVDHFGGTGASGVLPTLAGREPVNEDGKSSGVFIPRFRNLDAKTKHPRFLRGYGYEGGSSIGAFPGAARRIEGFGSEFKKNVRRWYTAPVGLTTRANMLSRFENFVEIDPDGVVDAWGIPALRVHIQHSDNEREMGKDAAETAAEILENAGAKEIAINRNMTVPGRIIHELGTARMGADPKKSVLNKYNQLHDVPNVFVTDGAAFVGAANQNPTLTILALTMRACEYLVGEMKRGNI